MNPAQVQCKNSERKAGLDKDHTAGFIRQEKRARSFFCKQAHSPVEMKGYKEMMKFSGGLNGDGMVVKCQTIPGTGTQFIRGQCPRSSVPQARGDAELSGDYETFIKLCPAGPGGCVPGTKDHGNCTSDPYGDDTPSGPVHL